MRSKRLSKDRPMVRPTASLTAAPVEDGLAEAVCPVIEVEDTVPVVLLVELVELLAPPLLAHACWALSGTVLPTLEHMVWAYLIVSLFKGRSAMRFLVECVVDSSGPRPMSTG